MAYTERLRAGDDQRGDDEVGRVGDRRQRVGRQHREAGDARQALVMREVRRNRLAEEKPLESRKTRMSSDTRAPGSSTKPRMLSYAVFHRGFDARRATISSSAAACRASASGTSPRRRRCAKACTAGCETCPTAASKCWPKATPTRSSGSSARMRHGPPGARVERVEVDDSVPSGRDDRIQQSDDDMDHLKAKIRHVPDFPKAGILFYDITTLLQDAGGLSRRDRQPRRCRSRIRASTSSSASRAAASSSARPSPIASAPGFSPVRKPGKLPSTTRARRPTTSSTAPTRSRCTHDAVREGQRVLIVDDLLATGGTARATTRSGEAARRRGARARVPHRARRAERPGEAAPAKPVHSVLKY